MTSKRKFDVFVSGYSSSVDEYRQAMTAPRSELPQLTGEQQTVARKMGVSEEDYARGVLAGRLGESRMRRRGEGLGHAVEELLTGLGPDYRLDAVKADMFNERWLIRIVTRDRVFNIPVPRDLADDLLDSGASKEIERLKNCLLVGLGRSELIADRR